MAKRHTEGDRHAKQEMDLMTDLLHNFRVEYDNEQAWLSKSMSEWTPVDGNDM